MTEILRELYLERMRPFYDSEHIKVITGVRRSGKSTILRQMREEIASGDTQKDRMIWICGRNEQNVPPTASRPDASSRWSVK